MFIGNCGLTYGADKKILELSEEDQQEFAQRFPRWWNGGNVYIYEDCILDDRDVEWLTSHGFEVNIKRIRGLTGLSGLLPAGHPMPTGVVNIHIPNVGLLAMNEVELLEDACTDNLQYYLDDGWRIIAVCPPNSQRRPDYILGRVKGG